MATQTPFSAYLGPGSNSLAWFFVPLILEGRIRLEIVNHKAKAAIALGDLDLSTASITAGVNGAKALGSQKRCSEAREPYQQMIVKWPREQVVKDIAGLFQAS